MKVSKRIVISARTIGYEIQHGNNKLAITKNDAIALTKAGILDNVTICNNCLIFTDGNSFRSIAHTIRIKEEDLQKIHWINAKELIETIQHNKGINKKAKVIGGIFNSLDGALLGYRFTLGCGSEIRKSLQEIREELKKNTLSYTIRPEYLDKFKDDFKIQKRFINGGILFYYINLLDSSITKHQLDILFGPENNILERVNYNILKNLSDKLASMDKNEQIQHLINKTNKVAYQNDLRINLKGVEISLLGRCNIGKLYSSLNDLDDLDNQLENALVCRASEYVFITPKKDIKELKKSGVTIKIESDQILHVSSLYESLVTNTDTETSIKIEKKRLKSYL